MQDLRSLFGLDDIEAESSVTKRCLESRQSFLDLLDDLESKNDEFDQVTMILSKEFLSELRRDLHFAAKANPLGSPLVPPPQG